MSGGFPLGLELSGGTSIGVDVVNARGTQVAANSGTAGTFSSWVQLTASTAADADWMCVVIQHLPSASYDIQINIGVGAAGSEKIIANQLVTCNFSSNWDCVIYGFPVNIPAGTRISAQSAGTAASTETNVYVSAQLFNSGFVAVDGSAGIENVGITSNHGTVFTTGAGAKGSYAQLTGSAARDYMGFYVVIDSGSSSTFAGSATILVDIAIGAGGSEKVIVPDIAFDALNGGTSVPTGSNAFAGPYFIPIPAGTAISVSGNAPSALAYGAMLLAMYQ